MSDGYDRYEVSITGENLLMHNAQLSDPLNKYAKALKVITSDKTRKKTDEGIVDAMRAEYEGGLYLDAKKRAILPSRVLEANIALGARKTKEGKNALAGMYVDTDGVLDYEGGPLSVEELLDSDAHRLVIRVKMPGTGSSIMRTRPLFTNWKTKFQVSVLASMASEGNVRTWLDNAGNFLGVGDYRPRYGRYEVTGFEKV